MKTPPPPQKKKSHVLICFLVKTLVFGSQDFPANNNVPDSPRIQTHQKVPSYSSAVSSHHSLGLEREEEGNGKTEAEPRKNDRNKRTVSAGHRTYALVFAFIFPQTKKSNRYLFASQKNILMEAKAFKVLLSCPNIWEGKESSLSGAEREHLS